MCFLKYFFVYVDFKDVVKEGNGKVFGILYKQLLFLFKLLFGFNVYVIEMFINILQNEVLFLEVELYQCIWVVIVNWKGGLGKNIEIDIL